MRTELLHSDYGHKIIQIKGQKVGLLFKNESGKHCCQRIPDTESKGRKQTSYITVAVLPIPQKVDIQIDENDLNIEPVNLGGSGGQHCNRTLSGCRMTHLPTGIQVTINGRDYHTNEKEARKTLKSRLYDLEKQQTDEEYAELRRSQQQGGGRSGKVRTYNFLQDRVKDHNLDVSTNIKTFFKGELDKFLKN